MTWRRFFWFFLIGICGALGTFTKVEASVLSATPYGDSCRYPRATPAGYATIYDFSTPYIGTGYDYNNVTVKTGTFTVNAPYDGYIVYVYMSHFSYPDSNVTVSAPGFSYNVSGYSSGNGGLYTSPTRSCNDSLTGISKYEMKLSAGITTFSVSVKNGSSFQIDATLQPPAFTNLVNNQVIMVSNPFITWDFAGGNAVLPTAYQLVGSLDGFMSWQYDSGEVQSTQGVHQIPFLTDGLWHFAVRTKTSQNAWTDWGYVYNVRVDTTGPTINLTQTPTTWTNQPVTIQATATDPLGVTHLALSNQKNNAGRNFLLNSDLSHVKEVGLPWDEKLNGKLVPASGWTEGYNGGVPQPTIGYHAHVDQSLGVNALMFPNKNEPFGMSMRWLGFAQSFSANSALGKQLTVGQKITVSFDLYADKRGGKITGGFYRRDKNSGQDAFYKYEEVEATHAFVWERKSFTVTVDKSWNLGEGSALYVYGHFDDGGATKWVKNIKVELGDKATPYTKAIEEMMNSSATQQYQVAANDTYTFTAIDGLGNVSTEEMTISNIDMEGPVLQLQADQTHLTKDPITITASASDAKSGVESIRLHHTSFDKNLVGIRDIGNFFASEMMQKENAFRFHQSIQSDSFAGIYIPASFFEEGTSYVLSFDITKLAGEIAYIGGHSYANETTVYIDGQRVPNQTTWEQSVPYPNDDKTHHVTIYFDGIKKKFDSNVYIQPNRGWLNPAYEVEITNIQLELGTVETPYEPSTNDTYRVDQTGRVQVDKNGDYTFVATDNVGNETFSTIRIHAMDTEGPHIIFTPEQITVGGEPLEVQLSMEDRGLAGYKQYRYVWNKDESYPEAEWSAWETAMNPVITQTKSGKWYLHVEAMDYVGNVSYAYSGVYEKLLLSGTNASIHIQPTPTGRWETNPITVSVLESGNATFLADATKWVAVTQSALVPATFTTPLPVTKQVTLSLQGENYIHVKYVLADGTTIVTTNGPYLLDTSTVGSLTMYVTDTSGQRVTSWHNQAVRLVLEDPATSSVSGVTKQYRIEGYHTEWQPYVSETMIDIEGNTRVLGRLINGAGQASTMQVLNVQLDFGKPQLQHLLLTVNQNGTYDVVVNASDTFAGIKEVLLDGTTRISRQENTYQINELPTKPSSVVLTDKANNQTNALSFAPEPVVTFEDGYTFNAPLYRQDVSVNIQGATSYFVGQKKTLCTTPSCMATIAKNTTLTVSNQQGEKETQKRYTFTNLDKAPLSLVLSGKRNPTNPKQMEFEWNYPLTGGTLVCMQNGVSTTQPISGKTYPFEGENALYECYVKGTYANELVTSNRVVLYATKTNWEDEGIVIDQLTTPINVYIDENASSYSYIINGKSYNYKGTTIPFPLDVLKD